MSDGNPPSSWYDPPEAPYEVNDDRPASPGEACQVCEDPAEIEVEIRDMRVRYGGGTWIPLCKSHEDNALDEFIEGIKNYEPEYNEEED